MVNEIGFKIIRNAVIIRLNRSEKLSDILDSYPKLSDEQRAELEKEFSDK